MMIKLNVLWGCSTFSLACILFLPFWVHYFSLVLFLDRKSVALMVTFFLVVLGPFLLQSFFHADPKYITVMQIFVISGVFCPVFNSGLCSEELWQVEVLLYLVEFKVIVKIVHNFIKKLDSLSVIIYKKWVFL